MHEVTFRFTCEIQNKVTPRRYISVGPKMEEKNVLAQ